MKKIFHGLGALAAVVTPIVAVVSCSNEKDAASFSFRMNLSPDEEAAQWAAFDTFCLANEGKEVVVHRDDGIIIRKTLPTGLSSQTDAAIRKVNLETFLKY